MRRWNGWGNENIYFPLSKVAEEFLSTVIGEGIPFPDAKLEPILASIPPSPLPEHPQITTDPMERLVHARGQSFPDWIAMRSGCIGAYRMKTSKS